MAFPPVHPSRPARGFTLVELLVALAILALMALLSWRGIDGMAGRGHLRARHPIRQVAAGVGCRGVKLQRGQRKVFEVCHEDVFR